MEIAQQQQQALAVKESRPNLTNALQKGNRAEVNKCLEVYKIGAEYNYPALLKVKERLPDMVKRNYNETLGIVIIAITKALEAMNLSRPMNASQVVELAETVLDSSTEDFLALEDVVLFLQGLTRGKYGLLYESMDIPKFMTLFEIYREARHKAYVNIKEEQHSQFKGLGDSNRSFSDTERDKDHQAIGDYLREKVKKGESL